MKLFRTLKIASKVPQRSLFTKSYFRKEKTLEDPQEYIQKIHEQYAKSGIDGISSKAVFDLLGHCHGQSDKKLLSDITQNLLQDPLRSKFLHPQMVNKIIEHEDDLEKAQKIFELSIKSGIEVQIRGLHYIASQLYFAEKYSEAIQFLDAYEREDSPKNTHRKNLIQMASFYKIGTDEAFHQAFQLFNESQEIISELTTAIFANFAIEKEKFSIAIDTLKEVKNHNSIPHIINSLILAYVKIGDLESAMDVLHQMMKKSYGEKRSKSIYIHSQVMDELSHAVEKSEETMLKTLFSRICNQLDDFAYINSETGSLIEALLRPIKS